MDPIKGAIRLTAAWLAGILFAWLAGVADKIGGFDLPAETQAVLVSLITLLFSAAYYLVINWIQPKVKAVGYGLVIPRAAVYVKPKNVKDARDIIELKRL